MDIVVVLDQESKERDYWLMHESKINIQMFFSVFRIIYLMLLICKIKVRSNASKTIESGATTSFFTTDSEIKISNML
jgi:hypothetical protein